jgi:hypothetical protein
VVITDYDQGLVTIPVQRLAHGRGNAQPGVARRADARRRGRRRAAADAEGVVRRAAVRPAAGLLGSDRDADVDAARRAEDAADRGARHVDPAQEPLPLGRRLGNDLHRHRRPGDRQLGRAQGAARRRQELGRREHRRHPRPRHRRRHQHAPRRLRGDLPHDRVRLRQHDDARRLDGRLPRLGHGTGRHDPDRRDRVHLHRPHLDHLHRPDLRRRHAPDRHSGDLQHAALPEGADGRQRLRPLAGDRKRSLRPRLPPAPGRLHGWHLRAARHLRQGRDSRGWHAATSATR